MSITQSGVGVIATGIRCIIGGGPCNAFGSNPKTNNMKTDYGNGEFDVSPNWDRHKTPPRKISDAEKEYRKTLKEKPTEPSRLSVTEAKKRLAAEIKRDCPHYEFNRQNKSLLNSLAYYIAQDHRYPHTDYDLTKEALGKSVNRLRLDRGVLIFGRYGVGKSTICRAMSRIIKAKQSTAMKVVDDYNDRGQLRKYETGNWYFDDFGREREPQYARKGDPKIMSDLLETRYFLKRGVTIITTNLSIEEIQEQYGNRVESRLWEQFNMYALGGLDYRKQ